MNIQYGVLIKTYKREDGSTPSYLTRCLESVLSQNYENYKIFLIGDKYEDQEEYDRLSSLVPTEKLVAINLPVAPERDDPNLKGKALWCSAGAHAAKYGMNLMKEHGIVHHCRLDDDDYWLPNHLQILNQGYTMFPEAVYIYSNALYTDPSGHTRTFPTEKVSPLLRYDNLPPRPEKVIQSAASWRLDKIPIMPRTVLEQGRIYPGDADLWQRMSLFFKKNNLKTLYMPLTTVIKDSEGYQIKNT
jgi:cellulose synthase/poly-beta-1,6-N-acetylglucosamine synthase-like glycosyltransferase